MTKTGLKETGIFFGWIIGLFLIGGLTWFFTQSVRTRIVIRTVNRSLAQIEDPRRLEAPLAFTGKTISRWKAGKISQLGTWYTLVSNNEKAVVFSVMVDGILAPYVVFISSQGELDVPIPLGTHSVQLLERLPREVLQTYVKRIEQGEALLRRGVSNAD
jgi:hypothetical protein